MTNVHLFPLDRWPGADPNAVSDFAYWEGMELEEAFDFVKGMVAGLDRKMEQMGIPPEVRREAIEQWHDEADAGLISIVFRPRKTR